MFEKNKLKKLLIATLLFAGGCSFVPTGSQQAELPTISDDAASAQDEYKRQWLGAVTNKVFSAKVNVWGKKYLEQQNFVFDAEGNLHNNAHKAFNWHRLHRVIAFKSGTQAVVRFYRSAGSFLYNEIYALEVRGDKIYRTKNIGTDSYGSVDLGFTTLDEWDGKSYSSEKLKEFASISNLVAYTNLEVPDPDL